MLKRWPLFDGLRGRIGTILLLHTSIISALLGLLAFGIGREDRVLYRLPEADEAAVITYAVERAPPEVRPAVVAAVNTNQRHVRLVPTAAGTPEKPDVAAASSGRLAAALALPEEGAAEQADITNRYRAALGARPFHVSAADGATLVDYGGGRFLSERPVQVVVPIEGGMSIAIETTTLPVVGRLVRLMPFIIVVIVLLEIAAIVVLPLQTTRPVSRLLAAVRSDGEGRPDPDWPQDGPREIRELGEAFAQMSARLKHLAEQRTRILGAVAHDFRTYMTRLELRADFIADDRQREATMADLSEMGVLLDDTLAFAKHASVASRLPDEVIDLVPEISHAIETRRELGEEVDVAPLPDELLVRVAGISFQRMLANLIDNAIRYGGQAHVRVAREGDHAVVYVEDDGPGVPEDKLGELTEPFHRLEGSRARHTGGTGLGLAIVQGLLHRHGGDLSLSNRETGGLRAGLRLIAA